MKNYKLLLAVRDLLEIQTNEYFVLIKNVLKENWVLGTEYVNLDMEFWPDGAISGVIGYVTEKYLGEVVSLNNNNYDFWDELMLIQGYSSSFIDGNVLYKLKSLLENKKYAVQKGG